jgi:hypothetical protein
MQIKLGSMKKKDVCQNGLAACVESLRENPNKYDIEFMSEG